MSDCVVSRDQLLHATKAGDNDACAVLIGKVLNSLSPLAGQVAVADYLTLACRVVPEASSWALEALKPQGSLRGDAIIHRAEPGGNALQNAIESLNHGELVDAVTWGVGAQVTARVAAQHPEAWKEWLANVERGVFWPNRFGQILAGDLGKVYFAQHWLELYDHLCRVQMGSPP